MQVSDVYAHEQIAIFCCILIARHCMRLEDFIGYVAIMTLMTASKCQAGDQDLEAGGRLAAHIMLRLLQGSHAPPEEPVSATQPQSAFYLKYVWDRYLLVSCRRNLAVAPLLAVLKAMLVLSDSNVSREPDSGKSAEGKLGLNVSYTGIIPLRFGVPLIIDSLILSLAYQNLMECFKRVVLIVSIINQ